MTERHNIHLSVSAGTVDIAYVFIVFKNHIQLSLNLRFNRVFYLLILIVLFCMIAAVAKFIFLVDRARVLLKLTKTLYCYATKHI